MRRELSADAHRGVACWWSAERWLAHVELVYRRHYLLLRPQLAAQTGGGVSLGTVLAVAATHAGVADFRTGRGSRPILGKTDAVTGLASAAGVARRTASRARTFLRLAGLATEVQGGRQRSLKERMESWRRGDRARGWAAVYALHPSRTHPVDTEPSLHSTVVDVAQWCAGGTPPRSGVLAPPTPEGTVVSTGDTHRRQRPTCHGAGRRRRRRAAPNPAGVRLALQWRRHPRAPRWAQYATPPVWANLLALPAAHGWTAADLNQLLADHVSSGQVLVDRPRHPIAYLSWLLNRVDMRVRPTARTAAAQAEEIAAAENRKARQARDRQEAPHRRQAARQALAGPGREAVSAVLADVAARRLATGYRPKRGHHKTSINNSKGQVLQ